MQKANKLATELANKIGVPFKNADLLIQAITYSSYANLHNVASYERLEFLGDSVLSLIITDYIFKNIKKNEGELTKIRAAVVCEESLSNIATKLGLGQYILAVDNNSRKVANTSSILCDIFESILGAIYLEFGYKYAEKFVLSKLKPSIDLAKSGKLNKDYKTALQEKAQAKGKKVTYKIVSEIGESHNRKFIAQAYIGDNAQAKGEGSNKKAAEQDAAKNTLEKK
ncbi:ribonuclease III [Treponema sp. R6D11]